MFITLEGVDTKKEIAIKTFGFYLFTGEYNPVSNI